MYECRVDVWEWRVNIGARYRLLPRRALHQYVPVGTTRGDASYPALCTMRRNHWLLYTHVARLCNVKCGNNGSNVLRSQRQRQTTKSQLHRLCIMMLINWNRKSMVSYLLLIISSNPKQFYIFRLPASVWHNMSLKVTPGSAASVAASQTHTVLVVYPRMIMSGTLPELRACVCALCAAFKLFAHDNFTITFSIPIAYRTSKHSLSSPP